MHWFSYGKDCPGSAKLFNHTGQGEQEAGTVEQSIKPNDTYFESTTEFDWNFCKSSYTW